jgi:hypothetical protein
MPVLNGLISKVTMEYARKERFQVQYFVRTMDIRKESRWRGSVPLVKRLYPELACSSLGKAIEEAKRTVLESGTRITLQADACSRNRNQVQTKYRCWIDERGGFNELALA